MALMKARIAPRESWSGAKIQHPCVSVQPVDFSEKDVSCPVRPVNQRAVSTPVAARGSGAQTV